ncbi:MAG TPA: thioesterase family protein [Gemmataceae bacterium]|nr:thioesterase family protein [Gemmataceae bacterium]
MSAPFRVSRRVDFCDTDMAGIIHFSNFFRYMEFAEVAFLRSRGLSVSMTWGEEHLGFPRVSATCDFLRPVRFEDVVEIAVHVERVGGKSVTYSFDFTHEGAPVARGRISAVCCRMLSGGRGIESIEIPADIRARLLAENTPASS